MALNAREAIAHVKHALSSDKVPSVGGLRIVNDAGEQLVGMCSWKWLEGAQVDVSLYPDQPYIWLPRDVREITALIATDSINTCVTLTTPVEIARRRASTVNTSFHYWATLVYAPSVTKRSYDLSFNASPIGSGDYVRISDGAYTIDYKTAGTESDVLRVWTPPSTLSDSAGRARALAAAINNTPHRTVAASVTSDNKVRITAEYPGGADSDYFTVSVSGAGYTLAAAVDGTLGGAPRPRLDLWPTPASYEANAFKAYYRGGWTRVRSDDDAIAIPEWLEPLYLQVLRATALGYERDAEGNVAARMEQIRSSRMYMDATRRDGLVQPVLGPLQNGAAQYEYGINQALWNFDSTGGPI